MVLVGLKFMVNRSNSNISSEEISPTKWIISVESLSFQKFNSQRKKCCDKTMNKIECLNNRESYNESIYLCAH